MTLIGAGITLHEALEGGRRARRGGRLGAGARPLLAQAGRRGRAPRSRRGDGPARRRRRGPLARRRARRNRARRRSPARSSHSSTSRCARCPGRASPTSCSPPPASTRTRSPRRTQARLRRPSRVSRCVRRVALLAVGELLAACGGGGKDDLQVAVDGSTRRRVGTSACVAGDRRGVSLCRITPQPDRAERLQLTVVMKDGSWYQATLDPETESYRARTSRRAGTTRGASGASARRSSA